MELIDKITIEDEELIGVDREISYEKMVYLYLNAKETESDKIEGVIRYVAEIEYNGKIHRTQIFYSKEDIEESKKYDKKKALHTVYFSDEGIKRYILKEMLKIKEVRKMAFRETNRRYTNGNRYLNYRVIFNNNLRTYEDIELNKETLEIVRQIEEEEYMEKQLKNF